jgi:multiple sugar transport system permease protein
MTTNRLNRKPLLAYILLLPSFIGLVFYTILPLIGVVAFSLTKWDMIRPPEFIGLENYRNIFSGDFFFGYAVTATLYFAAGATIIGLVWSFLIALMLNQRIPARGFWRATFYIPYIVPIIGTTIIWGWMYQASFGLFNFLMNVIGMDKVNWLGKNATAMPSIIVMTIWGVGNMIVIFLAGLQNVPRTYLEAVEIDGGNVWHKFRHITLPLMSPIIFYNFLMAVIANLQNFGPAFVLTQGGPNNTTLTMVYLIWREGFQRNQMGHASALSVILFVFIGALTIVIFKLTGSRQFFEGE